MWNNSVQGKKIVRFDCNRCFLNKVHWIDIFQALYQDPVCKCCVVFFDYIMLYSFNGSIFTAFGFN